jgi:hypothetical protein
MEELVKKLETLFEETGHAHHQAYLSTDGADAEWPLWYADFLMDKLPKLINANLTKSELVYLLVRLSKEQSVQAPDSRWTHYYAKFFADNYS